METITYNIRNKESLIFAKMWISKLDEKHWIGSIASQGLETANVHWTHMDRKELYEGLLKYIGNPDDLIVEQLV